MEVLRVEDRKVGRQEGLFLKQQMSANTGTGNNGLKYTYHRPLSGDLLVVDHVEEDDLQN
jgi:hypothetical protein